MKQKEKCQTTNQQQQQQKQQSQLIKGTQRRRKRRRKRKLDKKWWWWSFGEQSTHTHNNSYHRHRTHIHQITDNGLRSSTLSLSYSTGQCHVSCTRDDHLGCCCCWPLLSNRRSHSAVHLRSTAAAAINLTSKASLLRFAGVPPASYLCPTNCCWTYLDGLLYKAELPPKLLCYLA